MFPHFLTVARLRGLLAATLAVAAASAQPSGGPYGPRPQHYSVPAEAKRVIYVAPDGSASAAGTDLMQPTSLARALELAVTGDAIILRGGTYRTGNLRLNQGITLQPHADETPVLKGTRLAAAWEAQPNGLWRTRWSPLFPARPADWWRRGREGRKTPLYRFHNDMVFVDGRMLRTVGWEGEIDERACSIDYEQGYVYIGTDPTRRVVEITAFDHALTRVTTPLHGRESDRIGPRIRGLTFTQYAFRALEIEGRDPEGVSPASAHGQDVVGTLLEDVTFTHCSRVAAYLRGDGLVVRHCRVSDTGTEGLFILSSSDVLLEKNILERNNVEEISGYYPAAVKIFNQCHRVTCRDNLVIDQPNSNGIWYDVGNVDGVFVHNWIEGALDGFFFEISRGAICAGNVFVNCDKGVRVLNSAGVHVYHNTFVNTAASFERTERSAVGDHFGWHPRTGPDVEQREGHAFAGNLLVADERWTRPLLRFEQPAALRARLTRPQVALLDDNVYVRADTQTGALALWSPTGTDELSAALATPGDLQDLQPSFERRSRLVRREPRHVLRSLDLRRLEPVVELGPGPAVLPEPVPRATGWTDTVRPVGAYAR